MFAICKYEECEPVNAKFSELSTVASTSLLSGVDVVELSAGVAGAYAGRLLAELGANVRRFGPDVVSATSNESAAHFAEWLHAGKHVDSSGSRPEAESFDGAHLIIIDCDGGNLDYQAWTDTVTEAVVALPRPPVVVKVRPSVFESRPVPGTGLTSSAWSGISWSMGDADKMPLSLPFDLADYQAGLHACASGLAVLLADPERRALRRVDIAGRDILAYYTGMITTNFIPYERPWARDGARPPGSAGVYPASIFPCLDGHVVFMCRSQREWDILLEAMGSPEWSKDPHFRDPRVVARLHADEADRHLVPWIAARTKGELMDFGRRHGLPVAPVRSVAEALEETQFEHRGFFTSQSADGGPIRVPGVPWSLSQTPCKDTKDNPCRPWPLTGKDAGDPAHLMAGLRVLDLSWVWSGPLVTSILGDLGAEIVKVEHTGHLDTGRHRGKARKDGMEVEGPEHEATPYFNQMNHGKRSITLNLKEERAREILLDLVEHCDVVVENMRPGVLDRLGIGYSDLAARNPAIVMLSMSMAGQSGPLRDMKGYAGIMAAMSGLESLIGYEKDHIVGSLAPALGDPNAAGHAMCALLAALHRRRVTGRGTWVDLSQIEALVCAMAAPVIDAQLHGEVEVPANRHPRFVPHGHFPCAGDDQWIAISVRNDEEWSALVDLGHDGLLTSREEWRGADSRSAAVADVEKAVAAWTATQERDVLVEALLNRGVAAAPVSSFEDLVASPWKQDRGLTVKVEHPYLGEVEVFTVPWRIGGQNPGIALPAPLLGADTDEVLKRLLGAEADEIRKLQTQKVLW
ncbi:CoA transferase [Mycolicibacterium sp. P9-22]|nr:CoA transferase [Mycolicibacterium sp. P9-22]